MIIDDSKSERKIIIQMKNVLKMVKKFNNTNYNIRSTCFRTRFIVKMVWNYYEVHWIENTLSFLRNEII